MTIAKNGYPISTLDDWEKRAGPKRSRQWKDNRSAKETARAWLAAPDAAFPEEVGLVLASHPAFGTPLHWEAEPEARLRFDAFPGEPRNSDLVIYARDQYGPYVVTVEAKADETFGETIADAMAAALERKLDNPRSNGIARIEQLAAALFGPRRASEPPLRHLRYQLLTAMAGAAAAAERLSADRAVLLIHEFVTDATADQKHAANADDLDCFLTRLSHGAVSDVRPGKMAGPFHSPGLPLFSPHLQLFVGKASRNLRQSTTPVR